ncbi:MAG: type II secretion system protein GspJ [Pseudomonadota bacterium]
MACNRRYIAGFTLLEVMVSVGILGLIMTLVWASSSQSFNAKRRIETRSDIYHQGTVALRKLTDDITVAFLAVRAGQAPLAVAAPAGGQPPLPLPTPAPATSGPSTKTFFIGMDKGEHDEVRFTSLSHLRLFKNAKESDQCKVEYSVATSAEDPGKLDLLRSEDVWLDATTDVKTRGIPIAENIKSFNLEYYDIRTREWRKEWDAEKGDWRGLLPMAVRVSLTFQDPDDEKASIQMSTAVLLPLSRGPLEY